MINAIENQDKVSHREFTQMMNNLFWSKEIEMDGEVSNDDEFVDTIFEWYQKGYAVAGEDQAEYQSSFILLVDDIVQDQLETAMQAVKVDVMNAYENYIEQYYD